MAEFPRPLVIAFLNIASQVKGSVRAVRFLGYCFDSEKVAVGMVSVEFPAMLTKTAYSCAFVPIN